MDKITKHFTEEIRKVKTELQSSKTSLDQLQRENAWLKENLKNASKNQDILMSKIESVALSSSKEAIYFDYGLGKMTSSTNEIVKFDIPRAISQTKIYDASTGKVTIEEEGLYFFYVHDVQYENSGWFAVYIYVNDELACSAYKSDGPKVHLSCVTVRHLKEGQQIYVKTYQKLLNLPDNYRPRIGFLGFKLQ